MTNFQWEALAMAIVALLVMAYGFGWCDGRDSMRRDFRRDHDHTPY